MKKQFISMLTVAAMMATTTTAAFAKDDFANASEVSIGQPTSIQSEAIY